MTISVNSKKKQVKKTFDELLMDLKTSNSEKVRYNAARVLGEMGDSKAVNPFIVQHINYSINSFFITDFT